MKNGWSLIELLVAIVIASIGVVTLSRYQSRALMMSTHALYGSLAIQQSINLRQIILENSNKVNRKKLYAEWNGLNKKLLPSGSGNFNCDKKCKIWVTWQEGGKTYKYKL